MALNQSALDYARTEVAAAAEAIRDTIADTAPMWALNAGSLGAVKENVSWVEDLSVARSRADGEALTFDEGRAYGADYTMETLVQSIRIGRKEFEYDPIGKIGEHVVDFKGRISGMLEKALWDGLLGNSIVGPDGVVLVSASHPHGPAGATQTNVASTLIDADEFFALRRRFRQFRRENGDYMNLMLTHLFVGPDQERAALEATSAQRIANVTSAGAIDGTSGVVGGIAIENVFQGAATVVSTPRLGTGLHFAFDLSNASSKPWRFKVGQMKLVDLNDDKSVAETDEYRWTAILDFAQGPYHWQRAIGKLS